MGAILEIRSFFIFVKLVCITMILSHFLKTTNNLSK